MGTMLLRYLSERIMERWESLDDNNNSGNAQNSSDNSDSNN